MKFLYLIFTLIYLVIVVRLFNIQVLEGRSKNDDYLRITQIKAERGKIFDIKGFPLALNQNSYILYIEPPFVSDREKLIETLSRVLEFDRASIEARLDWSKKWLPFFRDLNKEKKDQIIKEKLKGVGLEEGFKRHYPESSLAAHLLGFLGKNEKGESVGYFGVEGFYDKDLAGVPGFIETEKDILGRPIMIGVQKRINPKNGRDLVLTVDKTVQEMAKKKLLDGLKRYQAKGGWIVVVDPNSMAILAMAALPDFDPANYFSFAEENYKNPVISEVFEPGSIFKPLILAAALEDKSVEPDEFFNETGPMKIGGYEIKTWDNKYEGKISMTRILEKSSNVGMVYIGEKLGRDRILIYLKRFGFGQKTGIDLQGEVSGILRKKENWYPIDYAAVTFGQGIAVTPIQMITAFASIINGGWLYQPFVVKTIVDEAKKIDKKPVKRRRVVSEQTSRIMRKMLLSAVENAEAKWQRPKEYQFAGKTGTAQIAVGKGYDPSKTTASFIGFFPAEKPEILILVTLKEPKTSPWGSETAAPLFFELAREIILYYGIIP